jgi:hypothetical protein
MNYVLRCCTSPINTRLQTPPHFPQQITGLHSHAHIAEDTARQQNNPRVKMSVLKCGRICICDMWIVVSILCSLIYIIFVHIQTHAVYMWFIYRSIRYIYGSIRSNMRVHAIYNIIVECFFFHYILYLKYKKYTYIHLHENPHI